MSVPLTAFQKARWKLTGWYVIIWLLLIIVFTYLTLDAKQSAYVRVYTVIDSAQPGGQQVKEFSDTFAEFNQRFKERLLLFDLVLLVSGSYLAYFLSGKTLQPIEEMVTEQAAFAADVSHGLRTPLTTINLELEGYQRSQKNVPQDLADLFISIQEEVLSMTYLVEGLLALVRTGTDPLKTHFSVVDIKEMVTKVSKRMQPIAKAKGHRLISGKIPQAQVKGNSENLKQVLVILIDNAIKYSGHGSQISIEVYKTPQEVMIKVKDTGKGIPKTELPHIFTRYYRGKHKTKGTGLGLSIVQKIIEAHGGKITVASQEGTGTTFTLYLPRVLP